MAVTVNNVVQHLHGTVEHLEAHVRGLGDSRKTPGHKAATGAASAEDSIMKRSVDAIGSVKEDTQMLIGSIQKLGDQTTAVENIISAISDVTTRTNMLSLNATIEASKAGLAGRGFAVVADEVRKLAGNTAAATKDAYKAMDLIREKTT